MGNTYYTSDLHLGHRNIGKFRKNVEDTKHNTAWIVEEWIGTISKNDVVYCCGDNAFNEEGIDTLMQLPGRKIMYGGNHDDLPITSYLRAFESFRGCAKKSKLGWVSHFPMHPLEMYGQSNVHGHVHYQSIPDKRYLNVCCDNLWENIGSPFITLDQLRNTKNNRKADDDIAFYV